MFEKIKKTYNFAESTYPAHAKIARFIVSGGAATLVNIFSLFLLTHFLHIWYLLSSVIAFILSTSISFYLQKFWTFKNNSTQGIHKQAGLYFLVILLALCLNTFLMYVFVEFGNIHYLLAQILSGVVVAVFNYFMYQKFIFKIRNI